MDQITIDKAVMREAVDLVGESAKMVDELQKQAAVDAAGAKRAYDVLRRNGHCQFTDSAVAMQKLANVDELQRLVSSLSMQLSQRPLLGTARKQASQNSVNSADAAFAAALGIVSN